MLCIALCGAQCVAHAQVNQVTAFTVAPAQTPLEKGAQLSITATAGDNTVIQVRIIVKRNGIVVAEKTGTVGTPITFDTTAYAAGSYSISAESPVGELSPFTTGNSTFTVEQHGKAWTTGDGIAGGQMTAPQNKTVTPIAPLEVIADPNQNVSCAVSAATDFDTWTKGTNTGDEADGVTYRWTASGGRFSGGVSGATTTWVAPEEPGTYSLTCTVDDLPTEVIAPDTGTRNDSPLTSTVTIKVPPKAWVADSAIGVQEIETIVNGAPVVKTVNSGRITAPQDQKDADITKWKPKKVLAVIGSLVNCTIESATDKDRWTQGTLKGEDSDTVPDANYLWTGGDGVTSGFFDRWETDANGAILLDADGKPVPHLVTEKTGRSVSFRVSKTEDVTTAVTCTIADSPKAVIFPDTGTRDDADLVRSVSVKTYNPTSFATLKLYRTDATKTDSLGAEITGGAVGGTIKAVLEVQIGGKSKVADGSKSVRLRLEESDARHAEGNAAVKDAAGVVTKAAAAGENHTNVAVSLDGTWQMWNGTNWTGTGSPAAANDTGTPKKYRTILDWNTTSEQSYADPDADGPLFASRLLGHNGPHRAVVYKADAEEDKEIGFQTKDGDDVYGEEKAAGPLPVGVDVQNVTVTDVIANADNNDYIKLIPDSLSEALRHPVIKFNIEDKGDVGKYKYYVHIRDTKTDSWTAEAYALVLGTHAGVGEVTAIWNGLDKDGNPAPRGTYTFDIHVLKYDTLTPAAGQPMNQLDEWWMKMPYKLKIPVKMPGEFVGEDQRDGHYLDYDMDEEAEDVVAHVGYYLEDTNNVDAKNVKVDLLDPDLTQRASANFTGDNALQRHAYTDINLYTITEGWEGESKGIFAGEDKHGNEYRDHENKRMLAINTSPFHQFFHVEDDWMVDTKNISMYPQKVARGSEVYNSFFEGRWSVLTANRHPTKVLPTSTTAIDYVAGIPASQYASYSKAINSDGTPRFHYYNYRNIVGNGPAPDDPTFFGHYVHVIYASRAFPIQDGYADQAERYSYIFVKSINRDLTDNDPPGGAIGDAKNTYWVKIGTIHELGHQVCRGDHPHQGVWTAQENAAYNESNIAQLKLFRVYKGTSLTRNDFFNCVMNSPRSQAQSFRFCEMHKRRMRAYKWEDK